MKETMLMSSQIPAEEQKSESCNPLGGYVRPARQHINPLIHNKGSAIFNKDFKASKVTSSQTLDVVPEIQWSQDKPSGLPHDSSREVKLLKPSNATGSSLDRLLLTVAEFESQDDLRPHHLLELPLFEVHHTMQLLLQQKSSLMCTPVIKPEVITPQSSSKEASWDAPAMQRAKSMAVEPRDNKRLESMAAVLSPQQHEYLSVMYAFKAEYLLHILNQQEVYLQYVQLSKTDFSFTNSRSFNRQLAFLIAAQKNYLRSESMAQEKKTLVLDLDETLVHTTLKGENGYHFSFFIVDDEGLTIKFYVTLRPYLMEFLDDMEQRYELIIYTAAHKRYAEPILNHIERRKKYFAHRLYKDQCIQINEDCLWKHLDILCGNRKLENIVLVDNTVRNFSFSIRNGLPVKEFKGDQRDRELIYLGKCMRALAKVPDVRVAIKDQFAAFLLGHYRNT